MSKQQTKTKDDELELKRVKEPGVPFVEPSDPGTLPTVQPEIDLEADAGSGSENVTAKDTAIPMITILQSNSPQCKRSDAKYVAGAQEGMLYNTLTNEVYADGLTVVNCFVEKVFLEWKPGRGGFAGVHDRITGERLQAGAQRVVNQDGKTELLLDNGNLISETDQHYVLVIGSDGSFKPAVIAMSSSGLKKSRLWNGLINDLRLQKKDGSYFNPARFYATWKLTTQAQVKGTNSWFTWAVAPAGPASQHLYLAGKAFYNAVKVGAVKVKQEQTVEAASQHLDEEGISF